MQSTQISASLTCKICETCKTCETCNNCKIIKIALQTVKSEISHTLTLWDIYSIMPPVRTFNLPMINNIYSILFPYIWGFDNVLSVTVMRYIDHNCKPPKGSYFVKHWGYLSSHQIKAYSVGVLFLPLDSLKQGHWPGGR